MNTLEQLPKNQTEVINSIQTVFFLSDSLPFPKITLKVRQSTELNLVNMFSWLTCLCLRLAVIQGSRARTRTERKEEEWQGKAILWIHRIQERMTWQRRLGSCIVVAWKRHKPAHIKQIEKINHRNNDMYYLQF